jgi:predicted transcriptional regulator/GNAT superfamily N-acetyltransferase
MGDETRIIILPIQQEFADAILGGRKPFEFRKTVGERDPIFVLLYVRESASILGAFAPGRILRGSPTFVWRLTKGRGTNRERFDTYFENQDHAVALEVRRYERFESPISDLEIEASGVVLPPNFNLVYANKNLESIARERGVILRELQRRMPPLGLDSFSKVAIADFEALDRAPFVKLVTEDIGKWYDDIGVEFAESIIISHEKGLDPHGLLSLRKTVHAFVSSGIRIGYSVATEKRGGSVKFGPTVLHREFQGHGFGLQGRRLLEEVYKKRECRKAYSTIPDSHHEALTYLLKAGYRVEAHLKAHYSRDHGEFVLGRRLGKRGTNKWVDPRPTAVREGVVITPDAPPERNLRAFISSHLSLSYDGLDDGFVSELSEARSEAIQEAKPRGTMFARAGADVVGLCVVSGKRGGAVKLAPFAAADDPKLVGLLFEESEDFAHRTFEARKLYTVIPAACGMYREELEKLGFELEGLLTEPYRPGIDMFVYSKFPKGR